MRILVVEDEFLLRELALEDLTDAGHDVATAASGDEALRILEDDTRFSILFTDIRMPGRIDGWELAREALDRIPGLGVVYVSGYTETVKQLDRNERFLSKPYRSTQLIALLNELDPRR
jgi:CheY-like chemotaxis protein